MNENSVLVSIRYVFFFFFTKSIFEKKKTNRITYDKLEKYEIQFSLV